KSMRWGDGDLTFGRPLRWLAALFGEEPIEIALDALDCAPRSFGHRFLHPEAIPLHAPAGYVAALREARVLVDPAERRRVMHERLVAAASAAGGSLIEDEFLMGENLSLVEDPQVVVGSFDEGFLALPEEVILEVARGHQRYFGLRGANGELLPKYLAVVNTAENPAQIKIGNDRVMRARLADARFFHEEDLKRSLASRRPALGGIVFQNRLGSILDKVGRMEGLTRGLGELLAVDAAIVDQAVEGASLAKNDLVTYMVGEFPELQGEVGRAYALAQGVEAVVADVIRDHYCPKGASGPTAQALPSALVALADRCDTLVGCFAIGLSPTGGADPYGLRRACIGILRTLLDRELDLSLAPALDRAYDAFGEVSLDLSREELLDKLGTFFRDRLRGLLTTGDDGLPNDVVDAALGVAADRPLDARARARAIVSIDPETRAKVGEVFKRATNIAKDAPDGEPTAGEEAAEKALFEAFSAVRGELTRLAAAADYVAAFGKLATLAAPLGTYFEEVLVNHEDEAIRNDRLRLMRVISETCGSLAQLELLGSA
ncbi:MAG: glycine--tRNA ligase subunit beta, partial [Myxococcales bacterium]|nr:glycine--tRNA ligase subunit beta [Myxococcales bacterium]